MQKIQTIEKPDLCEVIEREGIQLRQCGKYLIAIGPEFLPQYDVLPKEIKKKFKKQLTYMKENPRHNSLQIHKLEGADFWEFYVDKGHRCVFKQEGNVYKLYYVGTHKLIDGF